jgi:hypothetical protein
MKFNKIHIVFKYIYSVVVGDNDNDDDDDDDDDNNNNNNSIFQLLTCYFHST